MWLSDKWNNYKVLDTASGEKLETWAEYKLIRPDPQVVWSQRQFPKLWTGIHGHYHRSNKGGGNWEFLKKVPDRWAVRFEPLDLTFQIKPMGFKHTGLFPEQAVNWLWFSDLIKKADKPIRVLNLFAYTGGATVAAAKSGASVVHIDSSKGMVAWAKENLVSSGLADSPVRFIVDDVVKFVEREIRRGNKYDGIIMDPPSFGRGPNGEVWKIEDEIFPLVQKCMQIMSDKPLFFLINSYTTGLQPAVLTNVLKLTMENRFGGTIASEEIGLPIENSELILPCGASGRWQA